MAKMTRLVNSSALWISKMVRLIVIVITNSE